MDNIPIVKLKRDSGSFEFLGSNDYGFSGAADYLINDWNYISFGITREETTSTIYTLSGFIHNTNG